MPFAKVNEEKREVSGLATLDNLDTQGDIVLAEASAKAFARARGNIREMHQPLAVGKMVDFREDEYYDVQDNKLYRGIFVTARVSKGAQDTWEKVLDGTLSGFSIGGEINEATNDFDKSVGRTVRKITDYDLTELSLVDNPANQKANVTGFQKGILSFNKTADGSVNAELGEATATVVENVFICSADSTVVVKNTQSETCPQCGTKMENAGWFESGGNRTEKVKNIVTKFLSPADKEAAPISDSEGGVEMSKGVAKSESPDKEVGVVNPSEEAPTGEKLEESDETSVPVEDENAEVDETAGTEEEGAESPDEVTDDETEISKKIDELHEAVKVSLAESHKETVAKVAELEKKIDDATSSFLAKATELESKMGEVGTKLETSKARLAEMEARLEKMNSSEAFRKSADLETEPAEKNVQKGTSWNGAFSGKSSGFSVDNLT